MNRFTLVPLPGQESSKPNELFAGLEHAYRVLISELQQYPIGSRARLSLVGAADQILCQMESALQKSR